MSQYATEEKTDQPNNLLLLNQSLQPISSTSYTSSQPIQNQEETFPLNQYAPEPLLSLPLAESYQEYGYLPDEEKPKPEETVLLNQFAPYPDPLLQLPTSDSSTSERYQEYGYDEPTTIPPTPYTPIQPTQSQKELKPFNPSPTVPRTMYDWFFLKKKR